MQTEGMIILNTFCKHQNIDLTVINALHDYGLIKVTISENTLYLPENQLPDLEKMLRLYYDMDINLEGIETITHLLGNIHELQQQIRLLKNKLSIYEQD